MIQLSRQCVRTAKTTKGQPAVLQCLSTVMVAWPPKVGMILSSLIENASACFNVGVLIAKTGPRTGS